MKVNIAWLELGVFHFNVISVNEMHAFFSPRRCHNNKLYATLIKPNVSDNITFKCFDCLIFIFTFTSRNPVCLLFPDCISSFILMLLTNDS